MPRPRNERHSTDLDAEIARLEQERKRLIQSEDQRRGAVVRELLAGNNGGALRALLQPMVSPRDAFLFGFAAAANGTPRASERANASRRKPVEPSSSQPINTPAAV